MKSVWPFVPSVVVRLHEKALCEALFLPYDPQNFRFRNRAEIYPWRPGVGKALLRHGPRAYRVVSHGPFCGSYEGTRLGRQEIHAELLEDTPGALWSRLLLEQTRVRQVPPLRRIVIGLDPGNEAGIIVAGLGDDGHGYVLEDVSCTGSPATWAGQAIAGYYKYKANLIVAEANHGGNMVLTTIATQDAKVATKKVWASQGKFARAEPISALYEKGLVHHVGMFAALEDQLCNWVPGEGLPSPNELDACVWALTELMLGAHLPAGLSLAPALDQMHLPPVHRRATLRLSQPWPGDRRGAQSDAEAWVRQRWGMEYDPDEY